MQTTMSPIPIASILDYTLGYLSASNISAEPVTLTNNGVTVVLGDTTLTVSDHDEVVLSTPEMSFALLVNFSKDMKDILTRLPIGFCALNWRMPQQPPPTHSILDFTHGYLDAINVEYNYETTFTSRISVVVMKTYQSLVVSDDEPVCLMSFTGFTQRFDNPCLGVMDLLLHELFD
jgi:hypothetical protein